MVDSSKLGAMMPDVMQRKIAGSSFLRRCWSYLFSLRISRVKIQQQRTGGVGLGTLQLKLWRVAVPCRSIEFSLFQISYIILSTRRRWLLSEYFSTWCDSKFINTFQGIFKTSIIRTDEKIIFIFLYGISIGFWLFSFTIFSW